jgi:hypothetical protein
MSKEAVRAVFDRINDAWLSGPPDEIPARIRPCYHADAVVCGGPDFKPVARGGDVCARSYQDFVKMAKVHSCTFEEPTIEVVDTTATCVCGWQMTYTLGDAMYTESGHEVLVLHRDAAEWRVVWRTLIPRPS